MSPKHRVGVRRRELAPWNMAPVWPWDDRQRSTLTREQIVQQSVDAMRLVRQVFPRWF